MVDLNLPVVVANLDGDRTIDRNFIPNPLLDVYYYTISVSFQPAIIKYALDNYAEEYAGSSNVGCYQYKPSVYEQLGK